MKEVLKGMLLILLVLDICIIRLVSGADCTDACYDHKDWYCKKTYNGYKAECCKCQIACNPNVGNMMDCQGFCQESQYYQTTARTPTVTLHDVSSMLSSAEPVTTIEVTSSSRHLTTDDTTTSSAQPLSTLTAQRKWKNRLSTFFAILWRCSLVLVALFFALWVYKRKCCSRQRKAANGRPKQGKNEGRVGDQIAFQVVDVVIQSPNSPQGPNGTDVKQTATLLESVISHPSDSGQEDMNVGEIPPNAYVHGTATSSEGRTTPVKINEDGSASMALGADPIEKLAAPN
ncbi:uncharacterized protein [Apostichopus japonicus]|uniref:uncharacterized protein isoform X1 n=1 Tax=Stichopus japonicus TaxID=307972 RepID=UPI003AB6D48A